MLNNAYDLMYKERHLYFRCVAELPIAVTLEVNGEPLRSSTINVSGDVGIRSPIPLTLAQALLLPTEWLCDQRQWNCHLG